MNLKMFALLDTKVGTFSAPFFMVHEGHAIRAVIDLAQDLNTTVGRHPADFTLCLLGEFQDETGQVSSHSPVALGVAVNFLPVQPRLPLGVLPAGAGGSAAIEPQERRELPPNGTMGVM